LTSISGFPQTDLPLRQHAGGYAPAPPLGRESPPAGPRAQKTARHPFFLDRPQLSFPSPRRERAGGEAAAKPASSTDRALRRLRRTVRPGDPARPAPDHGCPDGFTPTEPIRRLLSTRPQQPRGGTAPLPDEPRQKAGSLSKSYRRLLRRLCEPLICKRGIRTNAIFILRMP